MSDLEQKLDEIYDKLVADSPDPRAKLFQADFKAAEREAHERLERWRPEMLDGQRRYHAICGLDKIASDEQARRDVQLLSIGVREEMGRLIARHRTAFTRRPSATLQADK